MYILGNYVHKDQVNHFACVSKRLPYVSASFVRMMQLLNTCMMISMQAAFQPKLILGSNVEPLAALPVANRKDPQLAPPAITEDDARHGILSLLERGLIPPGADLAFEPSPVKQTLAQIHVHTADDRKQEKPAIAGKF